MRRTKDFDKLLAQELKDDEFAREFFLQSMTDLDGEPGLELVPALKNLATKMGYDVFSEKTGMAESNLWRELNKDKEPTLNTLNRLLTPLGLKVKLNVEEVA